MAFNKTYPVRFQHCDPAGIVFYPHYFFMFNTVIEDWFGQELGCDYAELHGGRGLAIPLARSECDFAAPSRYGERLDFELVITRLGGRSFQVRIAAHHGDQLRVEARLTCVFVDNSGTLASIAIPDDIRGQMQRFVVPE